MHCTLETQRVPLGESVRCFGKTAVLRRAEPIQRQVRRWFGAPKRNSPSGSAAGCFGAELWFGAPNRRRTPRFGAEDLPQTTSVWYASAAASSGEGFPALHHIRIRACSSIFAGMLSHSSFPRAEVEVQ